MMPGLLSLLCIVLMLFMLCWLPGPSTTTFAGYAGILPVSLIGIFFLPHLQIKCRTRFSKWPILFLFLMTGVRVGEAQHPGPNHNVSRRQHAFCIGCFNPSGLAGKAQVINEYLSDVDIWSISETHLTTKSLSSFRRGLVTSKSPFRYLTAGFPVPVRAHSVTSGAWKGVAVLSKHPTRAVPVGWDADIIHSSRALVTATYLANMWVTCGTVYGESAGTWHPNHLHNTNQVLHAVATQVCLHSTGLRVVAGDFNVGEDDVVAFNILHAAGFKDIQTLAAERWGLPIQNTCKCSTRVDFCYVSPELQVLMSQVTIRSDVWPDHSILIAHFNGSGQDVPRYIWRQPHAVEWPQFEVEPILQIRDGQETDQYRDMWKHIETTASAKAPQPFPAASKGRAQTLKPKRVVGPTHAPIKAPRQGDVSPTFFGVSLQHAHWYRQLRRLQSYLRFARTRSHRADPVHAASTWGAIKRAKGFDPSFAAWWWTSKFRVHGAPEHLPEHPPDCESAQKLYDSMLIAFRHLENKLKATSRAYAKARRLANPQLIFQDLKMPGSDSVDLLIRPVQTQIVHIDVESFCLQLAQCMPWNIQAPVFVNGRAVSIIHSEDVWIWVDTVENCEIGDTCTQMICKGDLDELFQEFQTTWSQRWNKHQHVPESQWRDILNFARKHAPPVNCVHQPLDCTVLRREIQKKRARTAKGLDGVSLTDLKHMPDGVLQSYCSFYDHAETRGRWPDQLTVGRVASIAKGPCPASAADFRPITVLSLGYRLWSSVHSRRLIAALDHWLPAGLFGSRLASHAGLVWSNILLAVEEAHDCGFQVSGMVCDIEKAFNCLSRPVIFELAMMMNLPLRLLTGWVGMLGQLARHFDVRQNLSPAVYSCTGFPEGDGLSVVAMILLDCLLHWWMDVAEVPCRTLTFVDDWQLLLKQPEHVMTASRHLERFCKLVDLTLDKKKTYAWCLTPNGRKLLRLAGHRVGHGGRNLGAHLQLTYQHTNASLQERANALADMWDRLRLSSSPYKLKVRALTVAAWPKGLHGVASTSLGAHIISRLRSGAMRGLQADGAGCSPWIHLGLIERPQCDPGFWCVIQSIRCVRDCAAVEFVQPVLTQLVSARSHLPNNSFSQTLLTRLQVLGWHLRDDGLFEDCLGPFCLFAASFQEIEQRAALSWQGVVAREVSHRHGLQDLHQADVLATRTWLHSLCSEDAGHCRKLLNGAHFTSEVKQHWCHEPDGCCAYCQCTDSRYHRFWQCEAFAPCRESVPPEVWKIIPELPEFLTSFGWSLRPASWLTYHQTLIDIPEGTCSLDAIMPLHDDWIDLFTDGSCHAPTKPWRLASWSVVQADPTNYALDKMKSVVLAASPLRGLIQSAHRAELRGVLEALRIARKLACKVRIWCDCLGVVNRVQRLLEGVVRVKPNSRHADLWTEVVLMIEEIGANDIMITKVASHLDGHAPVSAFEGWCFICNGLADHAATAANLLRPHSFWLTHQTFEADTRYAAYVSGHVQRVLLTISRAVVQQQRSADLDPQDVELSPQKVSPSPIGRSVALPEVAWVPAEVCKRFGHRIVAQVGAWFQQSLRGGAVGSHMWISFYQLYCDYMLSTGEGGPLRFGDWIDPAQRPNIELRNISFKCRCRWFTCLLKALWKAWCYDIEVKFTRPRSEALTLHAACAWLPWTGERLDQVEAWLVSKLEGPAKRNGRQLLRLPTASRQESFPTIESGMIQVR